VGRIAIGVSYDGSAYHGWQTQQPGVASVQSEVEAALSFVADHPVRVVCAGRTDAGVHATAQVIHFDTDALRSERAWLHGANNRLPAGIALQWARAVPESFHARYSAFARRYRYVILNTPVRPSLYARQVTWNHRPLDIARMRMAARHLVGEHDFSSFRAVGCQAKTPVREVTHLELVRQGPLILLDIRANAFLHHMVRNIAGVLMAVGAGKQEPGWVAEVLALRDRRQGGVTAPAYGLYLVAVEYPPEFSIPRPGPGPFFIEGP
jgi:tRNA pseudouridine38-40 synthase